jgi:hypothetical protein
VKRRVFLVVIAVLMSQVVLAAEDELEQEVLLLRRQTVALQAQLDRLEKKLDSQKRGVRVSNKSVHPKSIAPQANTPHAKANTAKPVSTATPTKAAPVTDVPSHHYSFIHHLHQNPAPYHSSLVSVHSLDKYPEALEYSPTALVADGHVMTYLAGTPIITVPYLGERPAFDGSDMIVNISSINRDVRLMDQRRLLYRAYERLGYSDPTLPIIALSGKLEPLVSFNNPYYGNSTGDLNLGSTELDVAAALNEYVEGFIGIVYDDAPPSIGGQRVSNSAFSLSLGFVNIGNLDRSPFYFTGGQLYAPFGRYSTSMVSGTLPMLVGRTLTRPFIFGYKTQEGSGPYVAGYGFQADTSLGGSGAGGVNVGYTLELPVIHGDFGVGFINTIADSLGMQSNNSSIGYFGGFASPTNGSELVAKVPGLNFHANFSIDRFNFAAEWLEATQGFRQQDLSFDGKRAQPSAGQLETSMTFRVFNKPATVGVGYQWTQQALALNLPEQRVLGVFNISFWRDTIESLEFRHDMDYHVTQYANGAAPAGVVNSNIIGSGKAANTVTAQLGVFF